MWTDRKNFNSLCGDLSLPGRRKLAEPGVYTVEISAGDDTLKRKVIIKK